MFKHAFTCSPELDQSKFAVLATGRTFVNNVGSVMKKLTFDFDVACNFSNNLTMVDEHLLVFRTNTYKKIFLECHNHMNDSLGYFSERVLATLILQNLHHRLSSGQGRNASWGEDRRLIYKELPEMLQPSGFSGTKNRSYIRNVLRDLVDRVCFQRLHLIRKNYTVKIK
jgi:hypothetical protein